MTTARVAEFWHTLRTRLDTPALGVIQGAQGRVYIPSDASQEMPGPDQPAGRTVILPIATLWPVLERQSTDLVPFLVRTDRNDFDAPNYDGLVAAEAAQAEIYGQLQGWCPEGFTFLRVAFAVYRRRAPERLLQRDEVRQCWFLSSDFQFEAAAMAVAP